MEQQLDSIISGGGGGGEGEARVERTHMLVARCLPDKATTNVYKLNSKY